jgi:hypothetical protein
MVQEGALYKKGYFRYNEVDKEAMTTYPLDDQAHRLIQNHCQGAEGLPLAVQVSLIIFALGRGRL